MATSTAMRASQWVQDIRRFFVEVRAEMRKVTWPDRQQLRQATGAIIVFVGVLGLVIFFMDWILQGVLVRGIPSLFGVR
jgi:preprotein translocase subunit SecE